MIWRVLRWTLLALVGAIFLLVPACALLTDARYVTIPAPNRLPADSARASPALLAAGYGQPPIASAEAWRGERAPVLLALFQSEIYGRVPAPGTVRVDEVRQIDPAAFGGSGSLERWRVAIEAPSGVLTVDLAVAFPRAASGPVPVFLVPNECGNRLALDTEALPRPAGHTPSWCDPDPGRLEAAIARFVFGEYVLSPPAAMILQRGYALAAYHESDIVPDDAALAGPALARLTPAGTPADERTGTIAAWAWGLSHIARALDGDPRIGEVALMGHSRRGKAVLLAAAIEPELDLVVSHQSGTGGAALSRREAGETVADVTSTYPHWFAPAFARHAGRARTLAIDQHQLLALIAPRPVLLGNAARDRWSDPVGTLLAANGAAPAWELHGEPAFHQTRLDRFDPASPLTFYMRGGTHGVTGEDWAAFLDFADAQLAGHRPE
ncbi:hypothetical protein E5163_15045 [Marinicauda algicola]|uniref:4-O-methyl-glucuronoyl methylesterase-like domain-containing protein n=1 Tax=Marinicauda algicola TaxID=2029849 RepID=A0A4S2GX05_9PROT|nr:hypothetical protein [Marinicauda algicola]TGY87381.1 hypothetical protein E5163_15045 [Marinicauda algicola]